MNAKQAKNFTHIIPQPRISKPSTEPLSHDIWYTNDNLKLHKVLTFLFISTSYILSYRDKSVSSNIMVK